MLFPGSAQTPSSACSGPPRSRVSKLHIEISEVNLGNKVGGVRLGSKKWPSIDWSTSSIQVRDINSELFQLAQPPSVHISEAFIRMKYIETCPAKCPGLYLATSKSHSLLPEKWSNFTSDLIMVVDRLISKAPEARGHIYNQEIPQTSHVHIRQHPQTLPSVPAPALSTKHPMGKLHRLNSMSGINSIEDSAST